MVQLSLKHKEFVNGVPCQGDKRYEHIGQAIYKIFLGTGCRENMEGNTYPEVDSLAY